MLLARVVSPLWGAQRASGLQGYKLLELETPQGSRLCAVEESGCSSLMAHESVT